MAICASSEAQRERYALFCRRSPSIVSGMAASDAGRTSSAIVGSFRGEAAPSRAQYAKSPDRLARRDCAGKQIIVIFDHAGRSEEHTSELQSLMRRSYAVFCLKKNTTEL